MDQQIIDHLKYLELLSRQFPTIHEATTEIINLQAILNLPKGTEHFLSDLHGEDEAFLHIIKSGSGIIRKKIDDIFGSTVTKIEKRKLAILIYYPQEVSERKIRKLKNSPMDLKDWYEVSLHRLILVLKEVSSKYTRSKVRKALPHEFLYIIEELLHHREHEADKDNYYIQILKTIIELDRARNFIIAISEVIQRLSVDHLHIIGDIFDRGDRPDIIMDKLIQYHSVDIQWGNHDIGWMGAASGSKICIVNTLRMCARYGQLDILDEHYGINILPIAKYAMMMFPEVEEQFYPKNIDHMLDDEIKMCAQIHKAATLLLLKLEEEMARRNPDFGFESRNLLSKIDFEQKRIQIEGKEYSILLDSLQGIDKNKPTQLQVEEEQLLMKLVNSFMNNERLIRHVAFLFEKGSIYKIYNGNLLYHGCIPLEEDGSYTQKKFDNNVYSGKSLLDRYEQMLRDAFARRFEIDKEDQLDIFWYLYAGKDSSLFGKDAFKVFERTFLKEEETHTEKKNAYYRHILREEKCIQILKDFGLSEEGRIINGHVPVKVAIGENPVKAGGRLIVIDGGLSKAYQKVTGIAGYTLIFNSHGMLLAAHEPFTSAKDAVENHVDMISSLRIVEAQNRRLMVADTDNGKKLKNDIEDLKLLLRAYKGGFIKTLLY
ncbi:MAG: fructose-1,6-bisphosphatase [Vallitaleaceae bacterium]|nr:fructose-1,6-bisphosphatase [Vallitaleaceae bacterium]